MKKVKILGALAVLIAGFAYYTLFYVSSEDAISLTESEQNGVNSEQLESSEVAVKPVQGKGTLESLRLLNENLECSISYVPEGQQTMVEGTYFVSGGNLRGDFLTDTPDLSGQVLSSIIIKGDMMYLWSEIEGVAYGIKADLSKSSEDVPDDKSPVPLDADVKYDCKPWVNVDNTVFVPQNDVLFQDISEMMQSGMEYGTVYKE